MHHQSDPRQRERRRCRRMQYHLQCCQRALIADQLRLHPQQIGIELGARARHINRPQLFCDDSDFVQILILLLQTQAGIFVAQISIQKTRYLGHVNPGQQFRVAGRVSSSIRCHAMDAGVNAAHPGDQLFRMVQVSVSGAGDELCRAPQPTQHVLLKRGVIPHAAQGQRMQHLQ